MQNTSANFIDICVQCREFKLRVIMHAKSFISLYTSKIVRNAETKRNENGLKREQLPGADRFVPRDQTINHHRLLICISSRFCR